MTNITCHLHNCRCNENNTCCRSRVELDENGRCADKVLYYPLLDELLNEARNRKNGSEGIGNA